MRRCQPLVAAMFVSLGCGDQRDAIGFPRGSSSAGEGAAEGVSGDGDIESSSADSAMSSSPGDGMTDGQPTTTGVPATTGGPGSEPDTGAEAATSEGVRFDIGGPVGDDGSSACNPETEECGCEAVDILFSVDISGSQENVLQQMRTQFPSFIDIMFDRLPPNIDLHIGVTTASMGPSASHNDSICGFDPKQPPPAPDQLYIPPTMMVIPGNGTQGRLWEYDGKPFFAANTSDVDRAPLKNWFAGVMTEVVNAATNKTYGDAELAAAAAAWAFHPISQTPGFIRDRGAVTVLFLTGDADHSYHVEDARFLHDTVVAAKAGCGGDKCIIGAGVLNGYCDDATRFAGFDFLRSFGKEPLWGDIAKGYPWSDPEEWRRALGDALAQFVADTCATIPPAE